MGDLLARHFTSDQRVRIGKAERAVRALHPGDLNAWARHLGTDKSSDGHGYAHIYQRHFRSRRLKVTKVLEIGVGGETSTYGYETPAGGQSLRLWEKYFPRARIVGVDIHAKSIASRRISFEQGDQSDPVFLARLAQKHGPFDIVIDDGSHIGRHISASFTGLWEHVKPGGFYVIEDISLGYHPDWEGGPPGTPGTAPALLQDLIHRTLLRPATDFRPEIAAMHVYGNLALLEKNS